MARAGGPEEWVVRPTPAPSGCSRASARSFTVHVGKVLECHCAPGAQPSGLEGRLGVLGTSHCGPLWGSSLMALRGTGGGELPGGWEWTLASAL